MLAQQLGFNDYVKNVLGNLSKAEVEITASKDEIKEAAIQVDALHNLDDGYVTIALKKDKHWFQYHYKTKELKDNIGKVLSIDGVNVYLTPNSFYKPFRQIENVRKLNSLYIDLDYYTLKNFRDLTSEQIIWRLHEDYFGVEVPFANFIVITGRGIAIYWLIEPVPYKALPLWNAVQKYFLKKLKDIGGDEKSIDAARVMRLSGSVNQKSGTKAKMLFYSKDRYILRDIQRDYLPELTSYFKNPYKNRKDKKLKIVNFYNLYSLNYSRLCDLVKLQEMRKGMCRLKDGSLNETGLREFMCFLYRYWSCCYERDINKALESTLEFNKNFKKSLTISEVKRSTESAEKAYKLWLDNNPNGIYKKGGYNYKNETLIKKLNIIDEEMRYPLSTIINDNEVKRRTNLRTNEYHKRKRRNDNGLTHRQQSKSDKIQSIKELSSKGYNQNDIAKILCIGKSTVSKYLRL